MENNRQRFPIRNELVQKLNFYYVHALFRLTFNDIIIWLNWNRKNKSHQMKWNLEMGSCDTEHLLFRLFYWQFWIRTLIEREFLQMRTMLMFISGSKKQKAATDLKAKPCNPYTVHIRKRKRSNNSVISQIVFWVSHAAIDIIIIMCIELDTGSIWYDVCNVIILTLDYQNKIERWI